MNKIYAHILLTIAITVSTTCMEQEPKPLNIQSSSPIVLPANSKVYSLETLNNLLQSQQQNSSTIYRKYTDLDYVPVYISTNTEEIELTPVYRPIDGSSTEYWNCITKTKKTVPQEKQKPHDTYLINRLYNSARDLIDFITYMRSNMITNDIIFTRNKKYITLIELMIAAKEKGITEDFMGNFSYEKTNDPTASFVFGCLKKYIITIRNTEEKLPFSSNQFYTNDNPIKTLTSTCKERITVEQIKILAPNYPTFHTTLWQSINLMINNGMGWVIPYLYASTHILSKKYPKYSHIININECFDVLQSSLQHDTLETTSIYNSLNCIEQTKKITKITQEKNLGYNFLTLEKKQTLKEQILWWHPKTYSQHNRNLGALFCILIEKYNSNRGNKITPNPIQSYIYNALPCIAVPDSFDTNLLDKNHYALKEMKQLIRDTIALSKKNEDEIQNLVDQHYIFNEKEQS